MRLEGAWLYPPEHFDDGRRAIVAGRLPNPARASWERHGRGKAPPAWVYPGGVIEDGGALHGWAWVAGPWKAAARPEGVPWALADGIGPRDYQRPAIDALEARGGGLVVAPCGAGKTGIGVLLAARLGVPTLVLVHTSDLARQWMARVREWVPGVTVGRVGGGKAQWDRQVVVATLQTLARRSWEDLRRDAAPFGLLLADEVHHVAATSWLRVMAALPIAMRVGLSATPERKDGLTPWIHLSVGPTVHTIEQGDLEDRGRTLRPDIVWLRTGHEVEEHEHAAHTMRGVLEDVSRRVAVVDCVDRLMRRGRRVLVLTSLVDHAQWLAEAVGGVALVGSVTAKRRAEALERFRSGELRVLVATQLADEGLDLPECDTVVLEAPSSHRAAVQQRIGRACRPMPGKPTPLVVDVVDRGRWAQRKQRAREALYRSLGWGPVGVFA